MKFHDFLHERLAGGGFTSEDALASFLPLLRQVVAAHKVGKVAPLAGLDDLCVEGVRIWFEEAKLRVPFAQSGKVRQIDMQSSAALEIVGEFRMTADVDQGEGSMVSLRIGKRGETMVFPVYLRGYVSWEHEVGHHDPLTDVFSLGMIFASLTCGLDLNNPDDLARFVAARRNLFDLNPNLHPVLAKAVVRMTELNRQRRPQDLAALLRTLENYRDQDIDFDFDLTRMPAWKGADRRSKRGLILGRLQQRLFEISRRNRLLHFRQTMHTVNLTWASVPLSFDPASIRPEQILTWNQKLQQTLVAGKPISLNRYLRFEEAVYLPNLLDEIRNEARRDQTEFGFAQLRLVLCFLRWSNLKEKPPERFDSPLVLLPVQLTKTKGVRDVYAMEALSTEAEINPVLRHQFKQLYAVELPEKVDLTEHSLDTLYDLLVARIQSSEPAVTVARIDRPRIQLIHARAQRRLDQYRKRVRLSGRGIQSFLDLDYSYDRDNYHPLGLRLFQTRIRAPESRLRTLIEETPRSRTFMQPPVDAPVAEKEKLLYSSSEEEANPFQWEFDLCNVTLGNFRYQKMSLVRDYTSLLERDTAHAGFDAVFCLEPRPSQAGGAEPPPFDESYPIVAWDPTQASAIGLARTGRDFIIQGPPGTGKSQTITNLIADFVMRGKRVLFVCEKRAAIDVVFHRLRQTGLHQLCCLIHDSQADKKEFIMDVKETYERFLESPGKQESADEQRKKLVQAAKKELGPLERFHETMRASPAQARIPLRQLLLRAIELCDQSLELPPQQMEKIPLYDLWTEHRDAILKLAATLEDIQGQGVFAQHPLKLVNASIVKEKEPLQWAGQRLQTIDKLLDEVESQLQTLDVPDADKDSREKVAGFLDYALKVQFLAARGLLSLLRPDSDAAKSFAGLQRSHQNKAKELEKACAANKHWRHKLAPEETETALEQARDLQRSFWRFLKPAWWSLRRTLNRGYHFQAHAVKPTWTQVLTGLKKEHALAAAVADLENQAHERLGFEGDFGSFCQSLSEVREVLTRVPSSVQTLHRRLLNSSKADPIVLQLAGMQPAFAQLQKELGDFLDGCDDFTFAQIRDELSLIEESLDELPDFMACLMELAKLPRQLAEVLRRRPWPIAQIEAVLARRSLDDIFRADRTLARFSGPVRARHVQRLERAYNQLHDVNAAVVRQRVQARFQENVRIALLPHAQLTEEQKEFKTLYNRGRRELEHEFAKTMRFKSIRDLVAGSSGVVLEDLKPVWLMSPLSVSDSLPLDAKPFDVVIFDEASQVTLEEAVPPIFRSRQIIVVGDEMQLPPTSFFSGRQDDDDDPVAFAEEDGQVVEYDLTSNSLLQHAARNLPSTMLGWHYRSRSESLISFSNAAFYQGRLLTVPEVAPPALGLGEIRAGAAEDGLANVACLLQRPVSFHFMDKGVYQQRRNPMEADYVANLVRGLLSRETGLSIGIVAFSEVQQDEINDALGRLAQKDEEFGDRLEAELEREKDGQFAGLLVKNLENIQGDERDVIILSVCYGHGPNGKMLMNFGPINQNGGERRLNVAFSRAKQHMVLVSSIRHYAITNDYNDGARCLKSYLRYAEAVSAADLAAAQRVVGDLCPRVETGGGEAGPDAVVAELIALLRERGYRVDTGVGQSSFRCDVAVRRQAESGYCLGILVDSESYYRHPDILERDVLRPQLLRAFGWKIAHVLTKDWYESKEAVLERLEKFMSQDDFETPEDADDKAEQPSRPDPQQTTASPTEVAAPKSKPTITEAGAIPPFLPGSEAAWRRHFELIDGASRKFWEITVAGAQQTVRFGRIGSDGQTRTKTFANPAAAGRDAMRLVNEKLTKGYLEKTADQGPTKP